MRLLNVSKVIYQGTGPFRSKNVPVGPSAGSVAARTATSAP